MWAWISPVLAGLAEFAWAVGLKYAEGFTRPWPSVVAVLAMAVGVVLLEYPVRHIPVGTAYAIRVGIVGLKIASP